MTYQKIKGKLTRGDAIKLKVFRHSKRHHNQRYQHVVGLKKRLDLTMTDWLNKHCQSTYSIDTVGTMRNLSFKEAADAVLFKLTYFDEYVCNPHGV